MWQCFASASAVVPKATNQTCVMFFGLFGPAHLAAPVTARLNKAFVDALETPALKSRLGLLMAEPAPSTPEQFGAFVKSELAKYGPLVKASGAVVD